MRRLSPHRVSRSLQIRQWTCAQCLLQRHAIRRSSSISSSTPNFHLLDLNDGSSSSVARDQADSNADHKKPRQGHPRNTGKYFVTTPIFYVNGDPHVGHMHSMVVADVIKRYREIWGKSTLLSTGTDEHGMKAAMATGTDPQGFCTVAAQKFKDLAEQVNMSEHVFVRTTQPEHKTAVQHLWNVLLERGYIYKGTHEGWYSVTDECFYKPSQIEDRQDATGVSIKVSNETGSTVEWTSEVNYCFKLSQFRDQLKAFYEMFPKAIVPKTYYNDVMNALSEPLEDISISRPRSRLSWGIEVPGDSEQTIYVWFDALVNYLSVTGYPSTELSSVKDSHDDGDILLSQQNEESLASESDVQGSNNRTAWPADVHVIGKDIVRFHCIFWPAFLMAAGLKPPRQILVHGHWTLNGVKMSKSLGNVISPSEVLSSFHPDVIRYYMIKEGGQEGDGNWNSDSLRNRYTFLCNTWGNLLSRTLSSKLAGFLAKSKDFDDADLKEMSAPQVEEEKQLRNAIESALAVYRYNMNQLNLEAALSVLDNLFRTGNVYMTRVQPWLYTKPQDRKRLYFIMRRLGEILRIGAILAQPFMPVKAKQMLDALGVKPSQRYLIDAKWRADQDYGSAPRSPYYKPPTLFPRAEGQKSESSGSKIRKGNGKGDKKPVKQQAGKDAAVEKLTTAT